MKSSNLAEFVECVFRLRKAIDRLHPKAKLEISLDSTSIEILECESTDMAIYGTAIRCDSVEWKKRFVVGCPLLEIKNK